ncbi:hypothetical protein DCAR_0101510 [Daucus carota subsp. sativus]|uniref:C2 domain-containing protein n=1 Tax=Daucus carota subsp. sativus TaxID=79200 RepID=A0AAF0W582_DAUCS|nr:PREDICTED: leucine-rich repeat extensin-like protein 5 [Daucus carota subsp. sativus]WOG82346.1 hypothetical protein DCAR_0101510 [Daucus carota subsp. sativus]
MATSVSGIHGHLLEVTVIGCSKLKDTEWISRQDPYVCLEYASSKFRTRTHTDGGKNPTFQEKFVFTLIEGLRELNVVVWNSNTITYDDFIGSGKVQLQKVLSQGYDDSSWAIHTKASRYAGEVRLIMHYANANSQKPPSYFAPSVPPYAASPVPAPSAYSYPPQAANSPYPPPSSYPYPPPSSASPYPPPSSASLYPPPSSASLYPPPSSAAPYPPPYSNQSYYSNQHDSASYPGSTYPPLHLSAYPPQPYPPSVYPSVQYPPPAQSSHHYPPGPSYPGIYPPPY